MDVEELKYVIETQREETTEIFKQERIIDRDIDKKHIKRFLSHPNILAILGVRRSGKSLLSWLLLMEEKYGYINFFDERLLGFNVKDFEKTLQAFYELYGDIKYIILDEIQHIPGWERFTSRLRTTKRIIITGSNSQLLSGELATSLTGRHIDFELYPFNFREHLTMRNIDLEDNWFYSTRKKAEIKRELEEYLIKGGFPETYKFGRRILHTIYTDIVEKDIIKRYNIRKEQALKELSKYLLTNYSKEISFRKLKNIIQLKDDHTVSNYTNYLSNAYLIQIVERFSPKLKEQILAPKKIYCIDTGLIDLFSFKISENKGRLMENLVFIELSRRKSYNFKDNLEIYYWKDYQQREVDFVVKEGVDVRKLIQVTYASDRDEINNREINSLVKASEQLGCKDLEIITWDYEDKLVVDGREIKCIPLWKWLLD